MSRSSAWVCALECVTRLAKMDLKLSLLVGILTALVVVATLTLSMCQSRQLIPTHTGIANRSGRTALQAASRASANWHWLTMLKRSCLCGNFHKRGEPCPKAVERAKARANSKPANNAYADSQYRKNRMVMIARAWSNAEPCWRCHKAFASRRDITCDHALPLRFGGTHTLSNLMPAHAACNSSHGGSLNSRRERA